MEEKRTLLQMRDISIEFPGIKLPPPSSLLNVKTAEEIIGVVSEAWSEATPSAENVTVLLIAVVPAGTDGITSTEKTLWS